MTQLGKHSLDELLESIEQDEDDNPKRQRRLPPLDYHSIGTVDTTSCVQPLSPVGGIVDDMSTVSDDDVEGGEDEPCLWLGRVRAIMGPRLSINTLEMTVENTAINTMVYGAALGVSDAGAVLLMPTGRTTHKYWPKNGRISDERVSDAYKSILERMVTHERQIAAVDEVTERTNACVIRSHLTVPLYGRLTLVHTMVLSRYRARLAAMYPGRPLPEHELSCGTSVVSVVTVEGDEFYPQFGGKMDEAICYTREALLFLYAEYLDSLRTIPLPMYPWGEGFTSMILSGFSCLLRGYATSKYRNTVSLSTDNYFGGAQSTNRAVFVVKLVCAGCGCSGINTESHHGNDCRCTTLEAGACCLLCLVFRFGVFYHKDYLRHEVTVLEGVMSNCYARASSLVFRLQPTLLAAAIAKRSTN